MFTSVPPSVARPGRVPQDERRARTREALLAAGARGLSRSGYSNLVLEQVAAEAGYTRGALYHLFRNKEALALAVVAWVEKTWYEEMTSLLPEPGSPLDTLRATAKAHAVFCRRDIARVMTSLRVEFSGRDHPVGHAVNAATSRVVANCAELIRAGRSDGSIPSGVDSQVLATGVVAAVEGLVIGLAGHIPEDEQLADRAVLGLLGVSDQP